MLKGWRLEAGSDEGSVRVLRGLIVSKRQILMFGAATQITRKEKGLKGTPRMIGCRKENCGGGTGRK